MTDLRSQFLLDPTVTFLNHGSFGATPIPVFETYQNWQRELERQPVEFMGRRFDGLMNDARARLADYLHCDVDGLIFVPNATVGVNLVTHSIQLEPGDEILTTNHEYGACEYAWGVCCERTGARYIRHMIDLPIKAESPEELAAAFWESVTPRTKVIYLSHITSPSALILPVAEICRRARAAGILTVIDGAHAPGQIPLDLTAIDADIYTGNCHKWLCAPKGSAFLYAKPETHAWLKPLIVSWGETPGASFVTRNQWQGTRDVAGFLSVPAAIDFQVEHNWSAVRAECHALASEARNRIAELFGLEPISPDSTDWFSQMVACPLPAGDMLALKTRLYDEFRVEVPLTNQNGQLMVRVSFQAYNSASDLSRLLEALPKVY
ncbi:MAG: aminotransferase class V-fold PLP-dependent enzyme [Anaerolineae bacterium]|nr:aminotransferase class V-fold PLP-dependent enzyme [Anaerolineae bacterium]